MLTLSFQMSAVVNKLQTVETGLEEQIEESEFHVKHMREAIADLDKVGVKHDKCMSA